MFLCFKQARIKNYNPKFLSIFLLESVSRLFFGAAKTMQKQSEQKKMGQKRGPPL